MLLLGGAPLDRGIALATIFFCGLLNLVVALAVGAHRSLARLPIATLVLLAGVVLLPLLQLVPLPPSIWRSFPGREVELQVFELLGHADAWLPLSVAPLDTAYAALMLVPLAGLYLSALALSDDETEIVMLVVFGVVLVNLAMGVVQVASGGAMFQLYDTAHQGFLLGTFANRNHTALFLAFGILVQAWLCRRFIANRSAALIAAGAMMLLLFAAIIGTASRTGIAFGGVAILISAMHFATGRRSMRMALGMVAALAVALVALFSFSGVANRSFERYGDLANDRRGTIWSVSTVAAKAYFPVGAGVGSFVDVYKRHEPIEALAPRYANHAHEDYLELMLEAGVVAIALILLAVWVWGRGAVRALRLTPAGQSAARAVDMAQLGAAVILLPLLHSFVDYPLRRMAIAAMFVLAFAWLARPSLLGVEAWGRAHNKVGGSKQRRADWHPGGAEAL